jgi:tetratricopeptide (TPR) repeat protein
MNERKQLQQAYKLLGEGVEEAQSDRFGKALNKFEKALELSQQAGDRSWQLNALRNLAYTHSKLGHQQQAIKFHRQALTVARKEKDAETERILFNKIGWDYCQLGDYDLALRFQARAIAPPLELNDERIYNAAVKGALCDMAKTLELRGNNALARQFSNQSDAPSFSILYVWKILTRLADVGESKGEKNRANKFKRLAKKASNECHQCLNNFAKDLEKIGDFKRAKEFNLLAEQTDKTGLSLITVVNQAINNAIQDSQKPEELGLLLSRHQLRVYYRVGVTTRSGFGRGVLLDDN